MRNDYFRYYKPGMLIPLLIYLGIALYFGIKLLEVHWGLSVSIVALATGLLGVIDKWLWKYPPFSWLYWSIDLAGTYEGDIYYSNPATGKDESKQVVLILDQAGSSIQLRAAFGAKGFEDTSNSISIQTELVKDEFDNYKLIYHYRNDGNSELKHGGYHGTNILTVSGNKKKERVLEGIYYTNREPIQTKGTMSVEFKSSNT